MELPSRVILLALVLLIEHHRFAAEGSRTAAKSLLRMLAEGLGTINITLGSVIGAGLQAINTILNNTNSFLQTYVWPLKAIAQALGMAGQIQGIYAQIAALLHIPIATRRCQTRSSSRAFLCPECPEARARSQTRRAVMPPFTT
jgi:hypothetical protein